jgi:hypothetical protein
MVEGHVPQGVEVQVLSSAHETEVKIPAEGIFCLSLRASGRYEFHFIQE